MTTYAIPIWAGTFVKKFRNARTPPADAPMPTTRKFSSASGVTDLDSNRSLLEASSISNSSHLP